LNTPQQPSGRITDKNLIKGHCIMPKAKKRSVKARAAKAAPTPVVAAEPKVIGVTAEELARGRGKRPRAWQHPTVLVERPRWIKGFGEVSRVPYAILYCSCNTDTLFEFRGDGKAPKPNCCTNAPAYPKVVEEWQSHLHIKVSYVDDSRIRTKMEHYDKVVDTQGRPRSGGGAIPRLP
jgi:hypothetical protein